MVCIVVGWFVAFDVLFLVVAYLRCFGSCWLSISCCWFKVGWLLCLGFAYCGVIVVVWSLFWFGGVSGCRCDCCLC